jgi:hypothetical protein
MAAEVHVSDSEEPRKTASETGKPKQQDLHEDGPYPPVNQDFVQNYRTILSELSLLTTVSVLLFGFLLASTNIADTNLEEWLYAIAVILVATSTTVFVLPVAYHHLQFPSHVFEKFQARTHRWMEFGLPMLAGGMYLSLSLAIWSVFNELALAIAAIPLLATYIAFILRKNK